MTFRSKLEWAVTVTIGISGGYLLNNHAENLYKDKIVERRIRISPSLPPLPPPPPTTTYHHNPLYFIH